jgi:protein SCO1/2
VTVAAVALLLLGAAALRFAFDRAPPPAGRSGPPAATAEGGGSVYDLGLQVRDADGVVRGLDELRGHPVVASMFFASCTSACPLLIYKLKQLEAAAPPELRADLRVLLVSFDPARDQPAVLVDVARRNEVDPRRWRISVAPDEASARAIAAVLGIRYRLGAGGMFDHTTAVTVLDRQGEVRGRSEDPKELSAILAHLPTHRPVAAR